MAVLVRRHKVIIAALMRYSPENVPVMSQSWIEKDSRVRLMQANEVVDLLRFTIRAMDLKKESQDV